MTRFGAIGMALQGPRASGRTHRMIASAPQGATLLAHDAAHEGFLRQAASNQGRGDLKFHTPRDHSLAGMSGEFVPDHHSVASWLLDAEVEIQKQIEEAHKRDDAVQYMAGALRTIVAIAEREKLNEIYGIAQAGIDLAELGPEGCAKMRGG